MADSWNSVTLIGNVGQAPYLGTTKTGEKYCRLSLCTSRRFKGKDGTFKKDQEWHSLMVWGKMAEWAEADVRKGMRLAIKGRIHYNKFVKDGIEKLETQIIVEELIPMSGKDPVGGETVTLHGDSPVPMGEYDDSIPF